MKSAPIGTVMPWGGQSSFGNLPNNIPTGWIVCDGRTFEANDFLRLCIRLDLIL